VNCIECHGPTRVTHTYTIAPLRRRRRRVCKVCGYRHWTIEQEESTMQNEETRKMFDVTITRDLEDGSLARIWEDGERLARLVEDNMPEGPDRVRAILHIYDGCLYAAAALTSAG